MPLRVLQKRLITGVSVYHCPTSLEKEVTASVIPVPVGTEDRFRLGSQGGNPLGAAEKPGVDQEAPLLSGDQETFGELSQIGVLYANDVQCRVPFRLSGHFPGE